MRLGIVGGGMLGLTAAWDAAKAGHRVTVFEAAPRCGGLAAPWQLGEVVWDRHYHVTLRSDDALRGLLRELDLDEEIRWETTRTGFYVEGTLHPFSSVRDFAAFPPLSPMQKARLAATIVQASRITDWRPLERVTAVAWLTRRCGRATVERIWLPLLRAKLGPYAERASAAFIWAIIARMYGARRGGGKRESFGYVPGGYDRVLRRFEERLARLGVELRTSCRIERVEPAPEGVAIVTEAGRGAFDRALVTLAAPLAARLCPALSPAELALGAGVEYQGIVCASLLLDEPLSPHYITNIADASIPFTAVIEMSALVDRAAFGGASLVYLPKYVAPDDPALLASDREIEDAFLAALERMHPRFSRRSVRAFRVSRVRQVFPVPTLDYSERLPPVRTTIPALFVASSAHIVNGTLNVNETVKLAHEVSAELLARTPARVGAIA
ncbi:MAG TPA: NAD(P)/FAD-dependent oxidoreductase [Candidatus Limnocylindria bacterium]|jgi:protoporphyrinogen oxidase|nr:NAD(P)/FAD-dependent oxidoreductase [Candidatus Limnocylindria bacterium]